MKLNILSASYSLILIFLFTIVSCSLPSTLPKNNYPWPITGPTDPQEQTSGMSFKLEVSDDQGIIDNPDDFDPDGDAVEFTAILTRPFGGPGADPDVNISSDGTFYIDVWDSDIAGYFGYYEITISDGELSRTTDFEIVVYFY